MRVDIVRKTKYYVEGKPILWRPTNWRTGLPRVRGHVGPWQIEDTRECSLVRWGQDTGADRILVAMKNMSIDEVMNILKSVLL